MSEYINNSNYTYYGKYRTPKFTDIYPSVNDFLNDYNTVEIPATLNAESKLTPTLLYYLLYSNYGNDHIKANDVNRFKYKLFSIIWQYGPLVDKERSIQDKLRALSDDEISEGSIQIYNNADNPSTDPSTNTSEYLQYIKSQNVTKNKKGKLESYALLEQLLRRDVVQEFLNRFKPLFLDVVEPEQSLLYGDIDSDVATL